MEGLGIGRRRVKAVQKKNPKTGTGEDGGKCVTTEPGSNRVGGGGGGGRVADLEALD